jgi:hypothetical protein
LVKVQRVRVEIANISADSRVVSNNREVGSVTNTRRVAAKFDFIAIAPHSSRVTKRDRIGATIIDARTNCGRQHILSARFVQSGSLSPEKAT